MYGAASSAQDRRWQVAIQYPSREKARVCKRSSQVLGAAQRVANALVLEAVKELICQSGMQSKDM